jgi:hypothetical protein
MLWAPVIALLAAAPPTGFTSSFERVGLVRAGNKAPMLIVDQIGATLTLTNVRLPRPLVSQICPTASTTQKDLLVLTCTTRRVWAALYEDKLGLYLDLRSLRGLPWDGETALPLRAWPIDALGIPDKCPGRLDATLGECALAEGKFEEAEAHFKRGRTGPDASFCYLRLGDLALHAGDPEAAVNLYAFIAPVGPLGRIARARLCELTGACMAERASAVVADTFAMSGALKAELDMMTWRREVFMGREDKVMGAFTQALVERPELCADSVAFCQRMLMAGLNSSDDGARTAALSGWLVDQVREGPHKLDLALAAARAAEDMGAPAFAANVLAAMSVPKAQLAPHLLRIVDLYLSGRDFVRANVVLEYAEGKLGREATSRQGWAIARRRIASLAHPQDAHPPKVAAPTAAESSVSLAELNSNVTLAAELARATFVRSRSQEPSHAP